ncbi:MAG: hypothetical protein LPK85_03840, partial [Gammaproteobacteria bacterium]|nr:hypothetical protein [Gammaproteobacteria bacterium]
MGEPHALRNNPEDRIKASVPPAKAPVPRAQRPRRKPVIRWLLEVTVLFVGEGVGVIMYEESQSSRLQARELSA